MNHMMNDPSIDALNKELKLSQQLQRQLVQEYVSLQNLLISYEKYRNDIENDSNISSISFKQFYETNYGFDNDQATEIVENPDVISLRYQNKSDFIDKITLLQTSDFLERVGDAFKQIHQRTFRDS